MVIAEGGILKREMAMAVLLAVLGSTSVTTSAFFSLGLPPAPPAAPSPPGLACAAAEKMVEGCGGGVRGARRVA